MKFFLRETESWSAVNKSKLHKTEKVSVIIEPSDNRYNSDLVCMVLENPPSIDIGKIECSVHLYSSPWVVSVKEIKDKFPHYPYVPPGLQ